MNIDDFKQLQEDEKNQKKAKDKFFRQYKNENASFKSELFVDGTGQLALQIIPTGKEPFQIVGEDIKIFYNLLSTLYNAVEIKKEVEISKKKIKSEN